MNGIELGKTLLVDNLLTLRCKMNPMELEDTIRAMHNYCDIQKIEKLGSLISVTHGVELKGSVQVMDVELMIPVASSDLVSSLYHIKPRLKIMNALYVRYEGNPLGIQFNIHGNTEIY